LAMRFAGTLLALLTVSHVHIQADMTDEDIEYEVSVLFC